jgi:hypothetical protein
MKYAKENGEAGKSPIVVATCSAKQRMCTYYTVSTWGRFVIVKFCIGVFVSTSPPPPHPLTY